MYRLNIVQYFVQSARIRSYCGPYSVQIRKNMDQNNAEYGQFLHSFILLVKI